MGNGMNKVLPGLYVGNYRDSKDQQQLEKFNITHIIAIHDSPRRLIRDKHYLCIMASDTPDQNLSQYFSVCNDFIHAARLRDGNVLIHCLAGMSRSVTVAVAYIMSVTQLSWKEALKVVRTGRSVANPNQGFQFQLQDFEENKLPEERRRLRERFPTLTMESLDKDECAVALTSYQQLLLNNDICEGNCVRGQSCPTGVCNADTRQGIFRKKSNASRSRLSMNQNRQTSSCPSSPRQGLRLNNSTSSLTQLDSNAMNIATVSLHRSASTMSSLRPRSSPSGLFSYTGSAPPSVHGSRVDLSNLDKGSAIYLGCSPPRQNSFSGIPSTIAAQLPAPNTTPNTGAISKLSSSRGSSLSIRSSKSPKNTPPASPKKQQNQTKTRSTPTNTMTAAPTTPSTNRKLSSATTSKPTTVDKSKPPMPSSSAKLDKKKS
ncbi:mucin-5AC [Sitodiplosis mosellana]|uniref:mucin-5AC n=1 Tax=Sitodiplosis mosellana TaxID=263140 RepID=UPI0024438399|nr:mucin-5AC [Sitodiplosis mosellana]XP_055312820.1 mucin-5AC [Sitodiplosis mosellana]XP_055312821.1 mucin-5AC [Sitodiplosis mosellana]XP_055312822.1 mucin-5AC [Sitodiplosis mosellana]XP_055312823.1 mucin-5AC [Sitodiplosis mosellana]